MENLNCQWGHKFRHLLNHSYSIHTGLVYQLLNKLGRFPGQGDKRHIPQIKTGLVGFRRCQANVMSRPAKPTAKSDKRLYISLRSVSQNCDFHGSDFIIHKRIVQATQAEGRTEYWCSI
jgi:hypothetical protein